MESNVVQHGVVTGGGLRPVAGACECGRSNYLFAAEMTNKYSLSWGVLKFARFAPQIP